jgi:hypothetical protein
LLGSCALILFAWAIHFCGSLLTSCHIKEYVCEKVSGGSGRIKILFLNLLDFTLVDVRGVNPEIIDLGMLASKSKIFS